MKSDHRHELKTNELADWLAHFPQWVKDNRTTIIAAAVVIVVAAAVYFWVFYQKDVASARAQIRLTNLVTQVPAQKSSIAQALAQGNDQAYVLLDVARDLREFAQNTKDKTMSALALIQSAEAIRTELHYRVGEVSRDELTRQIAQAQAGYQSALDQAASNATLAATAEFGLGLCEEELGNLDQAKAIYGRIASNADYEGTVARVQAEYRLETMDDYKGTVVFAPAPQPTASSPTIQITPGDANAPIVIPVPNDVPIGPALPPATTEDTNALSDAAAPLDVPDTNQPPGN